MIDPYQLTWWRERNGWSRQDLADKVAQLTADGHPDAISFGHRAGPGDEHEVVIRDPGGGDGLARTCTVCGGQVAGGGLTRDAIAKIENGERKPRAETMRALCAALTTYGQPVRPADLLRGTPRQPRSDQALDRDARLRRNTELRAFALSIGRPELAWTRGGRIRYKRELLDLYDEFTANSRARAAVPALAS
jgi:transcriptional regulator with XRE-family HTH domain